MNIIGVILAIALSALLISAVTFYGGSAYKQSRLKAELVKLENDINQISLAVKNHDVNFEESQNSVGIGELVKEGALSEAPFFDDGKYQRAYELRPNFTFYNNNKINFIYISIGSNRQLCDLINKKIYPERYGYVPPIKIDPYQLYGFLNDGYLDGEKKADAGSALIFFKAQRVELGDFLNSPDRAFKKVCFDKGELGKDAFYEVVSVIDIGSLYKDSKVMMNKVGL